MHLEADIPAIDQWVVTETIKLKLFETSTLRNGVNYFHYEFKLNVNSNEKKNTNATGEATYGGALRAPSQVPPLAFLFSFSL